MKLGFPVLTRTSVTSVGHTAPDVLLDYTGMRSDKIHGTSKDIEQSLSNGYGSFVQVKGIGVFYWLSEMEHWLGEQLFAHHLFLLDLEHQEHDLITADDVSKADAFHEHPLCDVAW